MKTIFRIFWFISVIFFCIFAYKSLSLTYGSDSMINMWISLGFMWFFWILQFFVKDFDYSKKDSTPKKKDNDRYKKTEDKYFK